MGGGKTKRRKSDDDKRTSFAQVVAAFGGWSPGGIMRGRVLCIRRADCGPAPDPDAIVAKLNSGELWGDVDRIEIVGGRLCPRQGPDEGESK